jgi:hypothetical protein
LQGIASAAFLGYSLTLIGVPRSVQILERFWFSESGAEKVAFGSGSALKRTEEFCFYESSLMAICIPSQVDCIAESPLAANALEAVAGCEVNSQCTILRHILADERDAMVERYFAGEQDVVSRHVRVIGDVCFSNKKFGSLNLAPDSELGCWKGDALNCAQCNVLLLQIQRKGPAGQASEMQISRHSDLKEEHVRNSLNRSALQDVHCR